MWTLVLMYTIFSGNSFISTSMTTIPGFKSKETCRQAGREWKTDGRYYDFQCLEVK